MAWDVIRRCGGQVRAGLGGAYAIDFAAVLMMAKALGARPRLIAEVLPEIEPIIIDSYRREDD